MLDLNLTTSYFNFVNRSVLWPDVDVSPAEGSGYCYYVEPQSQTLSTRYDARMTTPTSSHLDLLRYRRQTAALYADLRARGTAHPDALVRFRAARDRLFAEHPQSPLEEAQRRRFRGLSYFPYDPALRFVLPLDLDAEPETFEVPLRDDGLLRLERFARVHFELQGTRVSLSLFWVGGYGGGVFLPFRDATNGDTTYGGGRYLLDSIKGADLGEEEGEEAGALVLDFNYAYNPSCCYDSRWECPLAPPENRLTLPLRAGEKAFG